MDDIGWELVQKPAKFRVDAIMPVAIPRHRVVHDPKCNATVAGVGFIDGCELGEEGVFLPSEDPHLVPVGKCTSQRLGIDLGAGVVPRRVTVDDEQHSHAEAL
jgi:hypothetical protein